MKHLQQRKLNIRTAFHMLKDGLSYKYIAKFYNVAPTSIYNQLNGYMIKNKIDIKNVHKDRKTIRKLNIVMNKNNAIHKRDKKFDNTLKQHLESLNKPIDSKEKPIHIDIQHSQKYELKDIILGTTINEYNLWLYKFKYALFSLLFFGKKPNMVCEKHFKN